MRRRRFLILAALLAAAAFYGGARIAKRPQAPPRHPITGRQIAGIATDAAWLDRAAREQEEAPDRALALIGIQPGSTIADIGAGSGYMTVRIARMVGPAGRVYATDIQPAMLQLIERKAALERLTNVVTVQGTDVQTNLPEETVDLALMVDVYHELWHPQEMLRSVRAVLKPGARLVLIEYRKEDPSIPIAPTHRMSVSDVRAELEPEGFVFDRAIEELPRQHILIFHKPDGRS